MSRKFIMGNGADLYTQEASTEFKVVGSTGNIMFGTLYKGNSTASTDLVISSSGLLYSQGVPTNYVETLVLSSVGFDISTATPYGITYITANSTAGGDFSTSVRLLTLGAPITGVEKTIIFDTTAAAINTLDVSVSTDVGIMSASATTNLVLAFSSLATLPQVVTMVGLSTAIWGVMNIESTVGGLNDDTDSIRVLNAVRSS